MENNLQNALKHITDSGFSGSIERVNKGQYIFSFDPEKLAALIVDYAASVQKEVVVPSEEWMRDNKNTRSMSEAYAAGKLGGIDLILSELRRLNPDLTFTESK